MVFKTYQEVSHKEFREVKTFLIAASININSSLLFGTLKHELVIDIDGIKKWFARNELVERQVLSYFKKSVAKAQDLSEFEDTISIFNTLFDDDHIEANLYRQMLLFSILEEKKTIGLDLEAYCIIRHLAAIEEIIAQLANCLSKAQNNLISRIHELENLPYSLKEDNDFINNLDLYVVRKRIPILTRLKGSFSQLQQVSHY